MYDALGRARVVASSLAIPLIVLLASGCENDDVRRLGASSDPPRWGLEPVRSIGAASSEDPDYLFYRIGRVKLFRGLVLVVNDRSEIRIFDFGGRFVRSLGQAGEGPREFGNLVDFQISPEGALSAFDPARGRVVRMDLEGELVDEYQVAARGLSPSSGVVLVDGTLITAEMPRESGQGMTPVLEHDSVPMLRIRAGGQRDTVRWIPGPYYLVQRQARGPAFFYAPLRPQPHMSHVPGGGAYVDGASDRVRFFDSEGRITTVISTGRGAVPVTPDVVQEWVDARLAALAGLPRPPGVSMEQVVYPFGVEPPWPDQLPVYERIIPSSGPCVLLQVFAEPGSLERIYDIVHVHHGRVATLAVSSRVRLRDLDAQGVVAGVETDDFDVERVVLYRLLGDGTDLCRSDQTTPLPPA